MTEETELVRLSDLIDIKHGYGFKGEFFSDEATRHILLTPGNFRIGGGFLEDKKKYYDGPVNEEFVLKPNDLIITMTDLSKNGDTLGFPAIVPFSKNNELFLHNQRLGKVIIKNNEKILKRYLYYLLTTKKYQQSIVSGATGTTVKHTSPSRILEFEFLLPTLKTQQKIADILGSLDDKIELNRQMNQTLEAMAHAIFKSWFVDFDPVYAKMEGRDYPLPPEIMDLFPDELEESELGLIPKGWRVCTVSEEFRITMGQSPPGSSYNEEGIGIPFFQGRRDFGFRFPTERVYCTDPKRFAEKNDTLVSVRAPVGDINMAMDECCIGRGVAAIRHNSGSTSYTYYSMQRLKDVFNKFEAEGTVFGSISKDNFENISYIQPNLNVICAFENISKYLDLKIANNLSQSIVLAKMRDHLISVMLKGGIYV